MSSIGLSTQETKFEFLQLLVAQLQNQDPIEPVKQEEFVNQLTSFSTLEAVEKLNVRFDDMLQVQQLSQSFDLAGKDVRYVQDDQAQIGTVSEITVLDGIAYAIIDDRSVPVANIYSVIS